MLGKIEHIEIEREIKGEIKKIQYPICFTINVAQTLQKEYGSMSEGLKKLESDNENEPQMWDIIHIFELMINEGIAAENEDLQENRPSITHMQAGRIMTELGVAETAGKVKNVFVTSMPEPKNAEATQNQKE